MSEKVMINILGFFSEHTFLAFVALVCIAQVFTLPFLILNRIIRHLNIHKNGWPPAHCDADGDLKQEEDKEP